VNAHLRSNIIMSRITGSAALFGMAGTARHFFRAGDRPRPAG